MSTSCSPFTWSPSTVNSQGPTLIVVIIAAIIHGIFWIQFVVCSSLRKRNMMWLYAYLITDFLLITQFFILYGLGRASICLFTIPRQILCYFEASSKFYITIMQSYLLLAFNVCRYKRIVSNRNIYIEKPRLIVLIHFLIYILPVLNVIIQFLTNLAQVWHRRGGSCGIQYESIIVQIFNLFIIYIIPVFLNIVVLGLGIHHVSSTQGIASEQIILLRRKRQRILVLRTLAFYSIWLILWSPNILSFQFINVNSDPAILTSLLSYIQIALDPVLIGIVDVRFLTTWQTLWNKIKRHRQIGIAS